MDYLPPLTSAGGLEGETDRSSSNLSPTYYPGPLYINPHWIDGSEKESLEMPVTGIVRLYLYVVLQEGMHEE